MWLIILKTLFDSSNVIKVLVIAFLIYCICATFGWNGVIFVVVFIAAIFIGIWWDNKNIEKELFKSELELRELLELDKQKSERLKKEKNKPQKKNKKKAIDSDTTEN